MFIKGRNEANLHGPVQPKPTQLCSRHVLCTGTSSVQSNSSSDKCRNNQKQDELLMREGDSCFSLLNCVRADTHRV